MSEILPKVLIAMSKTLLHGLIITCLFSSVLLANEGNAQHKNIKEVIVSVALENATIKQAIDALEANTEFKFAYSGELLSATKDHRITLKVEQKSVAFVLKQIANETGLIFQQNDGVIGIGSQNLIIPDKRQGAVETLPAKVVSGKVTDAATGDPMAGASIVIKGTTTGTVTDVDGNYALNAEDIDVLVFSYIGFLDFETTVGTRTVIDVVLEEDQTSLQEVVVNAGYWQVNERERTGNISRITAQEIEKQQVTNPIATLHGRMPGVFVQQISGVPGGEFSIQIRGRNSIRPGANNPLYIVDGVPFIANSLASPILGNQSNVLGNASPLNSINPSDIESIEVLKDADATAIYGSRGANGVVLITTKKGKSGKTTVNLDISRAAGKVTRMIDLLNTEQYLEMRREAFANDGVTPTEANAPDLLVWDSTKDTDWQEELIGGTAHITNAQASISGGSADTQFLFGGGYYKESSVFPGDFAFQRLSGRFHLTHNSENRKLKATLSTNFVTDNNDLPSTDITARSLLIPPNVPSFVDEKGNLLFYNQARNPYANLRQEYNNKVHNLISNGVISYEILPGLLLKSSLGYTQMWRDELQTVPQSTIRPGRSFLRQSSVRNSSIRTWIIEPQAEYQRKIGESKLTVLIGGTFQENIQDGTTLLATGFSNDEQLKNIQAASNITVENVNFSQYRYNAFFSRVHYDWAGKYLINLTGRRDGSSRFGPGNQLANFGAVGAAWIFSNENFIQNNLPFLSFGKLRASYGTTGSDQIGDYQFLDSYSSTRLAYQGNNGLMPTRLFNPDFAWERNRKLEAGLEFGFVEDRIHVSASYYRNRSDNQLVGLPLPPSVGFVSVQFNLPALVENTGWELDLNVTNIKTENFTWTTSANLTIPRNKLVEYPNLESSSFANTLEVGKSLFIQQNFHNTGVDLETGVYMTEDVDGDGRISSPNDLQALKEVAQEYYGGVQSSLKYKGFELDFLLQFVKQTGSNYIRNFPTPGILVNQPTAVLSRWQKPGDVTDVQMFTQSFGLARRAYLFNVRLQGDNGITDASFIRLKNLSLSYHLPTRIKEKLNLRNFRIYILTQNLFTITDYLGLDPENLQATLPPLRTITTGIQFTL